MMMKRVVIVLLGLAAVPVWCGAELRLPAVYRDGMVIQRETPFRVRGEGIPETLVRVTLHDASAAVRADAQGRWRVELHAPPAGGPYTLIVRQGDETVQVDDVLCGEVWLCSGQSNMDWSVAQSAGRSENLAEAAQPGIRLFTVPRVRAEELDPWGDGKWVTATAETVDRFSAIGWHFARLLHDAHQVPVGMIQSAWGGTFIEAWMPYPLLQSLPLMAPALERHQQRKAAREALSEEQRQALRDHYQRVRFLQDTGDRGLLLGWANVGFDDAEWRIVELPDKIESMVGPRDGAFWFRRAVALPPEWQGQALTLRLGAIDDFDRTYVGGELIGTTGEEVNQHWTHPRVYSVPAHLTATNEILIAVRVFDHHGLGGFVGHEEEMNLSLAEDDATALPLAGDWRFEVEMSSVELSNEATRPFRPDPNSPGVLYNGMIHALAGYPMRGMLWYQGESNAGRPEEYRTLFPEMITRWREDWGVEELPFIYVQLANFRNEQREPCEGGWARIREAQQAALALPATGEAVILDVGEAQDIHPRDKFTPAYRLFLHAQHLAYGEEVSHESPYLADWEIDDTDIVLSFTGAYGGLTTRDGEPPRGFALRGDGEERWYWAEATIEGDAHIRVRHPEVARPEAVRYAWASNPVGNVMNAVGLPMSGFRTDPYFDCHTP